MMTNETPTPKQIMKDAYWNKVTVYGMQISYQMPDGHIVSAVRSYEGESLKEVEDRLVKLVQERWQRV